MEKLNKTEDIHRKQMGFIKFPNRSYPVYEGLNIIGRDPKATIRVKDLTFSKQHAIISVVNDATHFVSDFGSSNGTTVRLQKLVPFKLYEIKDQEVVTFGDITGEYHTGTDPNFNKENYCNDTQSQIDVNATTQLLINELPTQQIDNDTNKTQDIHEAETQQICKTYDDCEINKSSGDCQLLSKPAAIPDTRNKENNNIMNTENCGDISHTEMYDDIFANESFRLSLQNADVKFQEVVDETLPTDSKLNKTEDVSMDSDDIILSTQDNANIEQQTQQIILKQTKSDTKNSGPQQSDPKNKDDDDSATDIEDEHEFIKQIQQKSTQFNDSKEKPQDSDSETDAEEDLAKKITNLDDSTTDIEDNLIANCDININEQKTQEPQSKMSDENDEALLLVPTQLLDNKKTINEEENEEESEEEVDLLAGAPLELLESNENGDKNINEAPTQLLTVTPIKNQDGDETDDELLAPTQLLHTKSNKAAPEPNDDNLAPTQLLTNKNQDVDDGDETDDDLLAPTQLLHTKSNKAAPEPNDDNLAPTQLLTNKNQDVDDGDETDDDLLAPTQLLHTKSNENAQLLQKKTAENDVEDDDDDLPPTQLLSNESRGKIVDENDAPTQSLHKNQNDSIFSAPTQILEKNPLPFSSPKSILSSKSPKSKQKRNVNFSEDVIYDMPTQKLDTSMEKNIYDAPTQLLENKANQCVENIHEASTQLLERVLEVTKSSSDDSSIINNNLNNSQTSETSLKLVLSETEDESPDLATNKTDTKTDSKIPQPETQLEVDFDLESQKLYVEEKTSRPDNPLAHMFAEEPTQMTEDINIVEDKSEQKLVDIETTKRLQIKLHNIIDLTDASTSKGSISDENDFKQENKRGRPKRQKKEDKPAQNVPKLNIIKVRTSEETPKKKQEEKTNESLLKSTETDEDRPKTQKKEDKTAQNVPKINIIKVRTSEETPKKKQEEKTNESLLKSTETEEDRPKKQKKEDKTAQNVPKLNIIKVKTSEETPKKKQEEEAKLVKCLETDEGRSKKQKKEDKTAQNVPKQNIIKVTISPKKKQDEKTNESHLKSSETDEDKLHNTRGKRISYQQLSSGTVEKKTTRGRPKKAEAEEQNKEELKKEKQKKDEPKKEELKKAELQVKKTSRTSARRSTRQLQTPKPEDKNDSSNSSDLDDFINRVTRSKRTHGVAETPKKIPATIIEDSDSDSNIVAKKKVKKLEYTQETDNSEVIREKPTKRSMKIDNYSSDDADTNTTTFCFNTPNTKRRRYEPLNVTMNTQGAGEVKHKVVFTMLSDTTLETSVKKLGGSVTDSATLSTVLVTNKISRSLKFLTAVALGKPIVQAKWIQDSIKKNVFQDPWNYLLEDKESEAKFDFSLKDSLKRSSEKLLLTDKVFLVPGKKNAEVLKEIIEISGGKCVSRAPTKNGTAVVVSYEEEKAKYSKYLKQKNLIVVAAEAIFSSVLRQEVDWKQHLLS